MRKNLFIAAMVILAMASCSKNEVIENQNSNNLINFKPYVANSVKGVDIADVGALEAVGFKVYGSYKTDDPVSTNLSKFNAIFFNGEDVTYTTAWDYRNPKYWPSKGSLDFIAIGNNVEKVNNEPTTGQYQFTSTGTSVPSIKFTTSADPTLQKDLIASTLLGQTSTTNGGTTTFTFGHLLSKIDVMVENTAANTTLKVTAVKFTDIMPTGTYNFTDWNPSGTAAVNVLALPEEGVTITNGTLVKVNTDNGGLIIIPQPMTKIQITYTFTDNNNSNQEIETKTAEIDLATGTPSWVKNTHYTYTLSITPKSSLINFDVDKVEGWTPQSSSNVI